MILGGTTAAARRRPLGRRGPAERGAGGDVELLEDRLAPRVVVNHRLSGRVAGLGDGVRIARAPDDLDGTRTVERRTGKLARGNDDDVSRALDDVLDALWLGLARLGPTAVVHHHRRLGRQGVEVGGDDLTIGAILFG